MIEVKDLHKTYGKGKNTFRALKGVNFTVKDGASLAIVGKSGSGKSTLMHVMSGLDHPEMGQVVVGKQDILKLRGKKLDRFRANQVGFIFQSFFVEANETCYNNVALPLEIAKISRTKRHQKVVGALEAVGLSDKIKEKAKNLSGGQKQRLAIARAIVTEPQLLFADEPTGNLDSVTGDQIEDLLFALNKKRGATLIIVTHDDDLAAKCDQRVYLKDGLVEHIEGGRS